jgi:hypothetical protein
LEVLNIPIHQMLIWRNVLQMVVGPEGPDATALTWMRAVVSGKEDIFAFGAPLFCCRNLIAAVLGVSRHAA